MPRVDVANVLRRLPQIPLGIANDRLAKAPWLLCRTIQDRTTVRHCSLDHGIDVVDEDKRHLSQGVAILGGITRRGRSECQAK